jgi:predicted AAA+ superfamily ATPase
VGTPIALANIADDLKISPITAKRWLELLERMYVAFTVYPLSKRIPCAIRKPLYELKEQDERAWYRVI